MVDIENLKTLKNHTFLKKKKKVFSVICSKSENEAEKIFKEESIEILKILGLFENIELP